MHGTIATGGQNDMYSYCMLAQTCIHTILMTASQRVLLLRVCSETGEFWTTLKLHCTMRISGIAVVSSIAILETVSLSSLEFQVSHNTSYILTPKSNLNPYPNSVQQRRYYCEWWTLAWAHYNVIYCQWETKNIVDPDQDYFLKCNRTISSAYWALEYSRFKHGCLRVCLCVKYEWPKSQPLHVETGNSAPTLEWQFPQLCPCTILQTASCLFCPQIYCYRNFMKLHPHFEQKTKTKWHKDVRYMSPSVRLSVVCL